MKLRDHVALRTRLRRLAYVGLRKKGIEAVSARLLRTTEESRDLLVLGGASVGDECVLHGPLVIHNAIPSYANLSIGSNVHIGRAVLLDLTAEVQIQDDSTISMGATILTHEDVGEKPLRARYPRKIAGTSIGPGAYIGANATI